jgi:hypothetical protein
LPPYGNENFTSFTLRKYFKFNPAQLIGSGLSASDFPQEVEQDYAPIFIRPSYQSGDSAAITYEDESITRVTVYRTGSAPQNIEYAHIYKSTVQTWMYIFERSVLIPGYLTQ